MMPRSKYCYCSDKIRVVALLDVDSFEVQVRGKHAGIEPDELQNKPYAVICLITCSNQPAREYGIERGPFPNLDYETRQKVNILPTPHIYGKPENLTTRKAGDDIYDCIRSKLEYIAEHKYCATCNRELPGPVIEKSNCDEFILDLTNEVHYLLADYRTVLEYSLFSKGKRAFKMMLPNGTVNKENHRLLHQFNHSSTPDAQEALALLQGGKIVAEILDHIFEMLGYVVSAGVGRNKLMAKLACHLSKPNGLAILPSMSMRRVEKEISFTKVPGLGGTAGAQIKTRWPDIETIADFRRCFFRFNLGKWLGSNYDPNVILDRLHGIDYEPVVNKNLADKITCGKTLNTGRKNQAITKDAFIFHLYNRFREMRDHLLYEHDRHCGRTPKHLKLEIFQHHPNASGKRSIFRYSLPFPYYMMTNFDTWRQYFPFNDDLQEWKPLLGQFKSQINNCSEIPLFSPNGYFIPSLARINLVAYF